MRLNQYQSRLEYRLISQTGPVHEPVFTMSVDVKGKTYEASGPSKRAAKLNVAIKVKLINLLYISEVKSSSTYSSPPVPSTSDTKGQSYRSMPPPVDQQSPYSYGYGEEKKKMLTQSNPVVQGGNSSAYSTAYPSSVTAGHSYDYGNNRLLLRCL
uniref:DRBM domain-containing protein n=1 Tax=Xiphophorus couchianus TaxID=32473 RepID=A0A3B5M3Z7_9TELE